jgi:hypothetical protein
VRAGARLRDETASSDSASDSTTRSTTPPPRTLSSRLAAWLGAIWRWLRDTKPLSDQPASIRDVVRYTMAGGWIPGEHAWYWEAPGYAYGFLIAIPAAVIGNATLWITHKMWRLGIALGIYGLLALVNYSWLVQRPLRWFGYLLLWLGGA